jgi:hypothetical protein
MVSTSETGHAKNVANFQTLISFVQGYGAVYNPTKVSLTLPKLIALKAEGDSRIADVLAKNTNYNNVVNQRMDAFSGLKALATRMVNAFQATDTTDEMIKDAKTINRKLQGQRKSANASTPVDPNAPAPNTISTSQQSYTQLIQHFAGLISILQSEPNYGPNEADLKITALLDKQNVLAGHNIAVANAYVLVSNARLARNSTLYTNPDSIFETAADVKKYIKSVFGANSPEYAQVKSIEIRKPKL